MRNFRHGLVLLLLLGAISFVRSPQLWAASGDFVLTASAFNPPSVDPGVSAISTLSVQPLNGFSGSVTLSCVVTPVQTNMPTCGISQSPVTVPANPTLTVTTSNATPPTLYTVTVTGTASSLTHTAMASISVVAVSPVYTLTITTQMTPGSVHAGSGATSVVTVTAVNGYSGNVTLSCSAITPIVALEPGCEFNPATVQVTTAAVTSTLTVGTTGPAPVTAATLPYALWLPMPGAALIVVGLGSGARRRKILGWSLLCLLMAAIALLPACGGSNSSTSSSAAGNTPNNTYTFTLTGGDANGLAPSNTSPTVSLTVD